MTTSPGVPALVDPVGVALSQGRFAEVCQVIGILLMLRTAMGALLTMPCRPVSATVVEAKSRRGEITKYTAPVLLFLAGAPTITSRAPSPVTSHTKVEAMPPAAGSPRIPRLGEVKAKSQLPMIAERSRP